MTDRLESLRKMVDALRLAAYDARNHNAPPQPEDLDEWRNRIDAFLAAEDARDDATKDRALIERALSRHPAIAAQGAQEPVAYMADDGSGFTKPCEFVVGAPGWTPLYASPPAPVTEAISVLADMLISTGSENLYQQICDGGGGNDVVPVYVTNAAILAAKRALASPPAPVVDETMQRDAARYRWLRDVGDSTWTALGKRPGVLGAKDVDAAIDAALESTIGGPKL